MGGGGVSEGSWGFDGGFFLMMGMEVGRGVEGRTVIGERDIGREGFSKAHLMIAASANRIANMM